MERGTKKIEKVTREVKTLDTGQDDIYAGRIRRTSDNVLNQKLIVPAEHRHPGLDYYFARADRVRELEQSGWRVTLDKKLAESKGGSDETVRVFGGRTQLGKEYDLILMDKPKDWVAEEKAKKQARQKEEMEGLRRGEQLSGKLGQGVSYAGSRNKLAETN